jgi:class 3 adenylate cyclase
MMKAMEEGDILEAIEIYTLNLAHAETWVGMLDETLVICLENARGRKESADAPGIAEMQRNHKAVQKKLRELIKSDGNPARIRTLTRISARNNDFVADLDEHLTNLNREKAESKARAGAEAKSAGDSNRPAEDKAGADAGAAAGAGVVEGQRRREQALAEIKARCDKVETWDDINAIRDSLVFYPELSQNEKLLGECHEMLNTAGNRVQAAARSGEIPRKTPAEGLAPPARANAPPDLNRIERRMREQPGAPPVPDLAFEKPSSGFVTESWRRADPGAGTLARWAGVREEQYVNLAIVFTDIIGSTMLNSRIGDASWDEIRSAHFRQARRLVAGMNGWYIKDVGDAVLAVFKNAVDALSFAMELEKNTGHELVRITAGAHIGTVIIRGDDIFGNEVNLAARIQDKANPGEVWMSEGVRSEWRSRHGRKSLAFVKHSNVELKGLDEPITLWSVEPTFPTTPSGAGGAETKLFPSQTRLERERAKSEAEEIQRQSVLNRATAAAIAGHPDEVRDLIQLHPEMREVLEQHLKRAEQIKKESEEAETRFQSLLSRAAAAAAAGKSQEVRQLIKSHPERREALEPFLRQAEKVNEAERRFQIALSRAAAAAAAGNPEEVLALIQTHPDRREALEPLLRRAETFKEESKKPERQRQVVLERAAAAAFAGMTEEVRELMNSHPQWRQDLEPHLRRAEQVKKEGEAALGHIRHLQAVLTRATAAAAAGKTEEVRILMEQHEPFREQLIPHLHQAIQVQLQARAKEAATSEDIEALKGLLQTHKSALKSQPMLVKALESSLAETEARVHAEIKIKLLEKKILAEARKRVAVANSDEDIQLLDHWVDEQIGRLPTQNPALASELRALVTQAQHTLPKAKTPAAQADLDGWKLLALVRSQAKKFADEGDLDGVRSLITANPQWEPQLVPFMQEAAGTQIKTQASRAATPADVVALEKLIQKHRTLVDQNAEMAAEFDQTLQQARCAVKSRFKRRVLMWCLIFGVLAAAAGTIVFVLLSRKAPG